MIKFILHEICSSPARLAMLPDMKTARNFFFQNGCRNISRLRGSLTDFHEKCPTALGPPLYISVFSHLVALLRRGCVELLCYVWAKESF